MAFYGRSAIIRPEMSDNTESIAAEYAHYRRLVLERREDGTFRLGERERLRDGGGDDDG